MSSKRILFVAPPNRITDQLMPDIGIGFLASVLRDAGYSIDFIDMERDSISTAELGRRVKDGDYLMAGLKVFSSFLPEAKEVIEAIKNNGPNIKIVIGGPHPTYAYKESLESLPQVDVAVIGEGEKAVVELANAFVNEISLGGIESICFRRGASLIVNEKKSYLNLDDLPIPAWDLIKPDLYSKYENLWFFSKGKTIANISISRGCPFKCTFCSDFMTSGRQVRYRKIDAVIEEIERLQAYYGVDEIHLTDSIFTVNKKYAYDFSETLIRRGIKIHWATPYGTRLDTLDAPLLRVMEESGCYGTSVGIESGSAEILKFMQKAITPDKVAKKLKLIKETTNMLVQGFFILGYPTETEATIKKTIDFSLTLPLDMAMFSPFRITPGTEVAKFVEDNEPESAPDWSNQTIERVMYLPKGIKEEELEQLHRQAYRKFYLRPSFIFKFMKHIRNRKQIAILANKVKSRFFRNAG